MSDPQDQDNDSSYIPEVFTRKSEVGPEMVLINLRAAPYRSELPLACLFHVKVLKCDEEDPNRPSWSEMELLDKCHAMMSEYLEDKSQGLFVGRSTNVEQRTSCFYMEAGFPQPDDFLAMLQQAYPERQVSMEYYTDPDWTIYSRFYPTPQQMEEIMDSKVITSMIQGGADLMKARIVNFTAEFPNESAADSFIEMISPHGFEISDKGQADDEVWRVEFDRSEVIGGGNLRGLLADLREAAETVGGGSVEWGAGYSPDETQPEAKSRGLLGRFFKGRKTP